MREEEHVANERRKKVQRRNCSSSERSHSSSVRRRGGDEGDAGRDKGNRRREGEQQHADGAGDDDHSSAKQSVSSSRRGRGRRQGGKSQGEDDVDGGNGDAPFYGEEPGIKPANGKGRPNSDGGAAAEAEAEAEAEPVDPNGDLRSRWGRDEEAMYEPVGAREIQRQRNAKALKRHLREIAADWDDRINDLNTLRRGRVLRELKRFLRERIDFDAGPDEINRQVEVLLRRALDSNFEAFSNRNVGQVTVGTRCPRVSTITSTTV